MTRENYQGKSYYGDPELFINSRELAPDDYTPINKKSNTTLRRITDFGLETIALIGFWSVVAVVGFVGHILYELRGNPYYARQSR